MRETGIWMYNKARFFWCMLGENARKSFLFLFLVSFIFIFLFSRLGYFFYGSPP
jgi:hypothetical protein